MSNHSDLEDLISHPKSPASSEAGYDLQFFMSGPLPTQELTELFCKFAQQLYEFFLELRSKVDDVKISFKN
jgi:hypothetical protein